MLASSLISRASLLFLFIKSMRSLIKDTWCRHQNKITQLLMNQPSHKTIKKKITTRPPLQKTMHKSKVPAHLHSLVLNSTALIFHIRTFCTADWKVITACKTHTWRVLHPRGIKSLTWRWFKYLLSALYNVGLKGAMFETSIAGKRISNNSA